MTRMIEVTTTLIFVTTDPSGLEGSPPIGVWRRQANFACTGFQFLP